MAALGSGRYRAATGAANVYPAGDDGHLRGSFEFATAFPLRGLRAALSSSRADGGGRGYGESDAF